MNKIYRLIWSEVSRAWVAVSELVKSRGRRSSGSSSRCAQTACLALKPLVLAMAGIGYAHAAPPAPNQLPTGGQVVAGAAKIAQSGATMNIGQTSPRAAIDWQTFNVGAAAAVNFQQPSASSVTLNRVLDSNPSQIFGRINAPGQVFLTNPNGMYFAPGASVDVGSLVATTHGISNANFMAGNYRFTRDGAAGSVVNEGLLRAGLGGYIALLAPEVRNKGVIVAELGTVVLAAGEAYELQFDGNNTLAGLRVTPSTIKALVDNGNAVHAPGGLIILSAQATDRLQGGVVNNSGALEATGLVDKGGVIRLSASDDISHTGSIKAGAAPGGAGNGGTVTLIADLANPDSKTFVDGSISARGGSLGGNGGFVETSASHLRIGDGTRVNTAAPLGLAGTWLLDPTDFNIAPTGGDIDGATLSTNLGGGPVTILSSSGGGGTAGDVNVNDSVSWSANLLTLTAANNINVNANLTGTGTASVVLQAVSDIVLNSGKSITTVNQPVVLWANSSGISGGAIVLNSGSSINTNGGHLWMGGSTPGLLPMTWNGLPVGDGRATGTVSNPDGILIDRSSISTGAGNISLAGMGYGGPGGGAGVRIVGTGAANTSTVTSTSGTIDIMGFGGGDGGGRVGVLLANGGTVQTTGGGNITLIGQGSMSGTLNNNEGVKLDTNSLIEIQTGSNATLAINGMGGTGNSYNIGVNVRGNSTVSMGSTATGNVNANGTGGPCSITGCWGVLMESGGVFESLGASSISLTGIGGAGSDGKGIKATQTTTNRIGSPSMTGNITLTADTIDLNPSAPESVTLQSAGSLTIQPDSPGMPIDVGPLGTGTLQLPSSYFTTNFLSGFSGITIGNPGSGAITVTATGTTTLSANTTLVTGGNITLDGDLNGAGQTITLTGGSGLPVSGSGSITAANLLLNGSGANYALNTAPANSVGTLAAGAGVGNVSFRNNAALNIGAVGSTNGVSAGGTVNIATTTGNLTISQNVATTDISGTAVTLNAGATAAAGTLSGGDIVISGTPSITTGAGGRATIYTGSVAGSTGLTNLVGSGSGNFRYNSDIVTTNFTTPLGATGLFAIYREQPTVTVTATDFSKTYDAVPYSGGNGVTTSGFANGDTAAVLTGSLVYGGTSQGAVNANVTPYVITPSGYSNGLGYAIGYANGALTITPKTVTLSAAKTYDGSTSLTGAVALGALVGAETLTYSGATASDAHVATAGKFINAITLTDGSGLASNYQLPALDAANAPVTINAATLTPTLTNAGVTKIYDGTTNAPGGFVPTYGFAGLVSGDTVATLTDTGAAYNNQNVVGATNLNVSGLALQSITGANASAATDYALSATSANVAAAITPKTVTLSATKTYDGGTSLAGAVALGALVGAETLAYSGATASDAHVATAGKFINAITLTDGNGLASNYQLPTLNAANAPVTITPKAVTLAATKIYDGSTNLTGAVTVGTGVGGEALAYTGATANDANAAAAGKFINAIALTDGSGLASDYQLPTLDAANAPVTITPKTVTLAAAKTYDGGTSLAGAVALGALVGAETLTYSGATASDAHVATAGKFINAITLTDGSALASNYQLPALDAANAPVTINAATLTPTLTNAGVTKIYDGTTNAPGGFVPTYGFAGLVSGDTVATLTDTGAAYNNQNVVGATSLSVSGLALQSITGANASAATDYALSATSANVAAAITPKTVTLSATKTYDGGTSLAGAVALGALVGTETLAYSGATASDAHVATAGKFINAITLTDGSGLASNYQLPNLNAANAPVTITPKAVTLAATKIYDGSTNLTGAVTVGTGVGGEALAYTGATANDANAAAAGKFINAITLTDGSGLASNYQLPALDAANAPVTITPKTVTLAATKTYDGGTSLAGAVALGALVGAETLTYSGATASDAHVATAGKFINAITLTDGSGLASNYQLPALDAANAPVTINAATLTPTLTNAGVTKIYDGTTNAPGGFVPTYGFAGLVSGDTVATLTDTGAAYNNQNVVGATSLSVSGLALQSITGANASAATDYALSATSANVAAAITPKTVTLAATKTYDGGTSLAGAVALGALVGAETLAYSGAAAVDAGPNTAGNYISAITLANGVNGLASNYQLPTLNATNAPVTINAAPGSSTPVVVPPAVPPTVLPAQVSGTLAPATSTLALATPEPVTSTAAPAITASPATNDLPASTVSAAVPDESSTTTQSTATQAATSSASTTGTTSTETSTADDSPADTTTASAAATGTPSTSASTSSATGSASASAASGTTARSSQAPAAAAPAARTQTAMIAPAPRIAPSSSNLPASIARIASAPATASAPPASAPSASAAAPSSPATAAASSPAPASASSPPPGTIRSVQHSISGAGNTSASLNSLANAEVALAVSKGLPPERAAAAGKAFNTVLVQQLSRGVKPNEAVAAAQKAISAEASFPASKAPQVTAARNLMAAGQQPGGKAASPAASKTAEKPTAFDKSLVVALAKGASFSDAVKTAQQSAKTAEIFAKADSSPRSALSNTNAAGPSAAAGTGPLAGSSPQFQKSLSTALANGLPLDVAMRRAGQADNDSAAAARADAANPTAGLARGDASTLKNQPATGVFDKSLSVAMAKGIPVAEAMAQAAEVNAFAQRAIEADARSPLAGFSNGGAPLPKSSPDFDRALATAIARGETPASALASAERAVANAPREVPSAATAIASGKNVDAVLNSPGNSHVFKLALSNALAKGVPVQKALEQARKAEERNAFRFTLPKAAAGAAAAGTIAITTQSGAPLPAWLKYVPETRSFVAFGVPAGALPMKVVVNAGGQVSTVVVSEQVGGK